MLELPEVIHISRQLGEQVTGKKSSAYCRLRRTISSAGITALRKNTQR